MAKKPTRKKAKTATPATPRLRSIAHRITLAASELLIDDEEDFTVRRSMAVEDALERAIQDLQDWNRDRHHWRKTQKPTRRAREQE